MLSPTSLAYAAGLFDGEGSVIIERIIASDCITNGGIRYQLKVCIHLREHWLLQEYHAVFGGSLTVVPTHNPKHSPQGFWRMTDKNGAIFLEAILPYLRLKKEQAIIALEFRACKESFQRGYRATRTEAQILEQNRCYDRVKELNMTGVSRLIQGQAL